MQGSIFGKGRADEVKKKKKRYSERDRREEANTSKQTNKQIRARKEKKEGNVRKGREKEKAGRM